MISTAALEEAILSLLVYHEDCCIKLALKLPDQYIFVNPTHQKIAEVALKHAKDYSSPVAGQLEYVLENEIRQGERGKLLGKTIDILKQKVQEIDPAFVIKELDYFIETQSLQKNFQEALELLEAGQVEEAKQAAFRGNLQQRTNGSPGIWLNKPDQALSFLRRREEADFFSTGVQALDVRKLTLDKKTLSFIIAAKGKGKSWWLINVGKSSLQFHHKVLHITLEMSEEKTARRYIQALFALTKDQAGNIKVPYMVRNPETGGVTIDHQQLERDGIFNKQQELAQKLAGMYHYHLLIKEFATGTLRTENLYLYLEQLKREQGFVPDQIILDYADLMTIDRENLRIDTGRQYIDLRGLAVSGNYSMVTATQGNRESESAKLVRNTNVAEDWSKIATADLVLTYTQTPAEYKMGLARLYLNNARDFEDKLLMIITQNYPLGQFCLDSVLMNATIAQQLNTLLGEGS